jgi:UDP-N-acetylglucosamine 2-epimerase
MAGSAPFHDSRAQYIKCFKGKLPKRLHFFNSLNVWDICNLISESALTISTSLHVRILSSIYNKPRITINPSLKHNGFIDDWDNIKSKSNIKNLFEAASQTLLDFNHRNDQMHSLHLEQTYLDNCFLNIFLR